MLSLSCATTKLAAAVIALFTLSPPLYGQPHLLHGLKAYWSKMEMGVFSQCELQFKFHVKLLEVFQFKVIQFEVLKYSVVRQAIPSSSLKRRSLLTDDSDMTTALPSTITCICFTELAVLEMEVF
ncbi:hypothetical protein Tco_0446479 [Tanacetum coccineum]